MKGILAIVIMFLSLMGSVQGQKGYEVGGWIGVSQYYGELNSNVNLASPGLGFGAIGKYNFDTRLSLRASLNYSRLRGTDATASNTYEKNRNLSFYSNVLDFTFGGEFNFMNYVHNSDYENFSPYLSLGGFVNTFSPKYRTDSLTYRLRSMGTEGQAVGNEYSSFSWGGLIGLGFRWDVAHDISMSVEGMMRFTRSDHMDDVSGVYPDYGTLRVTRGQTAVDISNRTLNRVAGETGQMRGNRNNKDKYLTIGVTFLKYFGRIECP